MPTYTVGPHRELTTWPHISLLPLGNFPHLQPLLFRQAIRKFDCQKATPRQNNLVTLDLHLGYFIGTLILFLP